MEIRERRDQAFMRVASRHVASLPFANEPDMTSSAAGEQSTCDRGSEVARVASVPFTGGCTRGDNDDDVIIAS